MRCESSVTSSSSSDLKGEHSKITRSFSADDLKKSPSKGGMANPTICGIRADYIPYHASHPINPSYSIEGNKASLDSPDRANHHTYSGPQSSNTLVVIPSIDFDPNELKRMRVVVEFYEERQLYHLFLLVRNPSFRIIFVSSNPVDRDTVRYYLSLDGCSEVDLKERLSRLIFLNPECNDHSCHSLCQKVVKSKKLLHTIRKIVPNDSVGEFPTCGLSFFCGSDTGDTIAAELKFRSLEANGKNLYFGSKQGRCVVCLGIVFSRRIDL